MKLEDFMDRFSVCTCLNNYGADMAESSLADWLEFAALRDVRAPWSVVSDSWQDAGLIDVDKSNMIVRYYDLALKKIELRKDYLADDYPFKLDQFNCLVVKDNFDIANSLYIDLLLISLLKGFADENNREVLHSITSYFELLTNECLKSWFGGNDCKSKSFFKSAVIGTSIKGNFEKKLEHAANKLGLVAVPTAAPHSKCAKDDGVDIVCGLVWSDGRKTDLLWAVQAACGKSSKWKGKLDSIHSVKWAAYFDERVELRALIAIPYHITDRAINGMVDEIGNRSYLDRMRLVKLSDISQTLSNNNTLNSLRLKVFQLAVSELEIDKFSKLKATS